MIQGLAITNEQDIKAIHSVVSDELKAQIEKAFPELFGPKQHDFSDAGFSGHLPFFVGKGLCDHKDDRNKCLLVKTDYIADIDILDNGYQIIRFFERKS